MDSGNSQSEVPCNHAFRDVTNTEGKESCLLFEEEALTGISGENDRKRRRTFDEGPWNHDKGKNERIHPPKDFEACKHAKSITLSVMNPKSCGSQSSRGNTESQGECLVDKLTLRDSSSGQLSILKKADNSSIGHVPSLNSEADDISTESDEPKETFGLDAEQFMRYPLHSIKDHKELAFSCDSSLGWSLQSKNKADGGERLTDEKSKYISMCGSSPCSSCTKAAYMWSDLIYQDTRGRLSALKSSRRHARMLEGKILRHEKTGETSQSQLKKERSTESDLLQHWTSLLLRTEDTLLCEIMQSQSRIVEIENLKDKLKRDLKTIGSQPQNE